MGEPETRQLEKGLTQHSWLWRWRKGIMRQEMGVASRSWKRPGGGFLPRVSRKEHSSANTVILIQWHSLRISWPTGLKDKKFLLFEATKIVGIGYSSDRRLIQAGRWYPLSDDCSEKISANVASTRPLPLLSLQVGLTDSSNVVDIILGCALLFTEILPLLQTTTQRFLSQEMSPSTQYISCHPHKHYIAPKDVTAKHLWGRWCPRPYHRTLQWSWCFQSEQLQQGCLSPKSVGMRESLQ